VGGDAYEHAMIPVAPPSEGRGWIKLRVKVAVRPPSSTKSTLTGIWRIFLPKLVEDFVHRRHRARRLYRLRVRRGAALMQSVFSPVLGAFSDHYGRRPVVLLSNFGLGLDYIVMALAPTVPRSTSCRQSHNP
jgi:hypothetical protein